MNHKADWVGEVVRFSTRNSTITGHVEESNSSHLRVKLMDTKGNEGTMIITFSSLARYDSDVRRAVVKAGRHFAEMGGIKAW